MPLDDDRIILQWSEPFTFEGLLRNPENKRRFGKPGVYLWVDRYEYDDDVICYVGKHMANLWIRQWHHYICLIAGQYIMPMDLIKKEWEMDPNNADVVRTIFDEEAYIDLVRKGLNYARQIRLFLCPLESHQARRVERALLHQLQPVGTRPGTRSPPSEICEILHSNAAWLTEKTKRQLKSALNVV